MRFSINWCRLSPGSSTCCHRHLVPAVHNFIIGWKSTACFSSSERILVISANLWDFLLSFSSCSQRAVRPSVMPCRPLMLLTNPIALFCTASSSWIEAASAGSHRTSAYSSLGQHKLEYAIRLAVWGASIRAYLMHLKNFFALLTLLAMCLLNFRLDCITTPRYLISST